MIATSLTTLVNLVFILPFLFGLTALTANILGSRKPPSWALTQISIWNYVAFMLWIATGLSIALIFVVGHFISR